MAGEGARAAVAVHAAEVARLAGAHLHEAVAADRALAGVGAAVVVVAADVLRAHRVARQAGALLTASSHSSPPYRNLHSQGSPAMKYGTSPGPNYAFISGHPRTGGAISRR